MARVKIIVFSVFLSFSQAQAVDLEAIVALPDSQDEMISPNQDGETAAPLPEIEKLGKKSKCQLHFTGPGYLSKKNPNQKVIQYKLQANGKELSAGEHEISEAAAFSTVEKVARKEFPNDSSDQKTVVTKYLDKKCLVNKTDKESADYAFGMLSCLGKVYEKQLRSDIKAEMLKKNPTCL